MKLTEVRISGGSSIQLPIKNAKPSDFFVCKGIDGLGPTEVAVSIPRNLQGKGSYKGRRPQPRELAFRIGLNTVHYPEYGVSYTPSDLRDVIYNMVYSNSANAYGKEGVLIEFWNKEGFWTRTYGYVKRCEPNHFSKDPEVILTVETLNPFLEGNDVNIDLSTLSKSNPVIINPGNAPTGFQMYVSFTSPVNAWTFTHTPTGRKLSVVYPFNTGNILRIDTRYGSRSIDVVTSGAIDLIGSLTTDSEWLELGSTNNYFGTSSQNFNWTWFVFRPQYLGV